MGHGVVRRALAVAATVLVALVAPAAARADAPALTLQVVSADTVRVTAPAGVPEAILIGRDASGVGIEPATIVDANYPGIAPGAVPAPCASAFYGAGATCPPSITHVELHLGDQADWVDAAAALGPDSDAIFGLSRLLSVWRRSCLATFPPYASGLSVRIDGGDGDDTLIGSAGDDVLDGGAGRDLLLPAGGRDLVRGGSGFDAASFCGTAAPVSLSLDGLADDGVAGEGADISADIEDLIGGDGNDALTGDAGPNRLDGGPGADVLDGANGPDQLFGGAGDDRLTSRDGTPDALDCGAGHDVAEIDAADDTVACEAVDGPAALPLDGDGDGSPRPVDCNDADPLAHPGAKDTPGDGIDQDCDGHDAVDLDRDRDGSPRPADCDDDDPAISPRSREIPGNAVDEDCDGVAEPLPRVQTLVDFAFTAFATDTRVVRLRALQVSAGTALGVICHGGGCPPHSWSHRYRSRAAVVDLRAIGLRRLHVGATLDVWITHAGELGKRLRFRIRSNAVPAVSTTCVAPATRRLRAC